MRPGFDLITQHPSLLAVVSRINADTVSGVVACALLGAALVAILQGPAPVVVLVLVLVQTTARWDLRTALAVLAGSGLGAAVGALMTTPAGPTLPATGRAAPGAGLVRDRAVRIDGGVVDGDRRPPHPRLGPRRSRGGDGC